MLIANTFMQLLLQIDDTHFGYVYFDAYNMFSNGLIWNKMLIFSCMYDKKRSVTQHMWTFCFI